MQHTPKDCYVCSGGAGPAVIASSLSLSMQHADFETWTVHLLVAHVKKACAHSLKFVGFDPKSKIVKGDYSLENSLKNHLNLLEYISEAIELRSLVDSCNPNYKTFIKRMPNAVEEYLKNCHIAVMCRVSKVVAALLKTIADIQEDDDID